MNFLIVESPDDNPLLLTKEQRIALDARLKSLDQDRRDGTLWEDLKAELKQRCP